MKVPPRLFISKDNSNKKNDRFLLGAVTKLQLVVPTHFFPVPVVANDPVKMSNCINTGYTPGELG